jgi:hypothetical protein
MAERQLDLLLGVEHLRPVLRMALVVLLPVAQADLRLRGHDDPGLRSVDSGLERALG